MKKIITTKISTWGNGYGMRLPKDFVMQSKITPHQSLEVSLAPEGKSFVVNIRSSQEPISKEWFKEAFKKMKKVKIKELDWGKPVGREIW